jgi:hypothetical protein
MIRKEQIETLLNEIATGARNIDACVMADIDDKYFYIKQKKDPKFAKQIEKARVKWKRYRERGIVKHGLKVWTALAWSLQHDYPEQYGDKNYVTHKHTGEFNLKHTVDWSGVSKDEITALAKMSLSLESGNDAKAR